MTVLKMDTFKFYVFLFLSMVTALNKDRIVSGMPFDTQSYCWTSLFNRLYKNSGKIDKMFLAKTLTSVTVMMQLPLLYSYFT